MRSGSSARVRESLFVCVEQTPGVFGRAEEVGGLLPARVLVGRHEDRSAVTRDDLDSMVTGGDAVDERWQRPARFVGADGRRRSPDFTRHWSIISAPSPRMVARVAVTTGSGAQILHRACGTDVHLRRGEPARFRRRWTGLPILIGHASTRRTGRRRSMSPASGPPVYSTSRGPLMWRVSASKRRLTREAVESSMRPAKRRPCTRSRRCSMTASRRALSWSP